MTLTQDLTLTRLSADPHAQLADGRKECSAAQNGSTFKLDLYRSYDKHHRAQQTLLGGQAVRLIHKEAEGYIGSDHRRAQLGLPVYVQNAEVMHKHGSSNTIWLIEKSTPGKPFDGGTCLWEGQYRLRHLATGRLLAVIMEPRLGLGLRSGLGFRVSVRALGLGLGLGLRLALVSGLALG